MGLQASLVTVLGVSQSLHTGWGDFFVVQAVGTVDCVSVYVGRHVELNVVFGRGPAHTHANIANFFVNSGSEQRETFFFFFFFLKH